MNREMEELLRAAAYEGVVPSGAAPVTSLQTGEAPAAGRPVDAANLAVEVRRLVDVVTAVGSSAVAPPTGSGPSQASERSTAETALRTAAMMTGVGPLVGGLLKLFGSDEPEPLPPLEKFQVPSRVSVEAGLTGDREYASLRYTQGGLPVASSDNAKSAPTVNVNIQALDSRSFLDRQDDIARAVREAMLHSNSLNDVVLEL